MPTSSLVEFCRSAIYSRAYICVREKCPTARRTWDEHAARSGSHEPAGLEFRSYLANRRYPSRSLCRARQGDVVCGQRGSVLEILMPPVLASNMIESSRSGAFRCARETPMTGVGDDARWLRRSIRTGQTGPRAADDFALALSSSTDASVYRTWLCAWRRSRRPLGVSPEAESSPVSGPELSS